MWKNSEEKKRVGEGESVMFHWYEKVFCRWLLDTVVTVGQGLFLSDHRLL